jgi:hypothetical protein
MESVEGAAEAEKKMRGVSRASETVEKAATPLFRMDDSLLRAESDCLRQRDSTLAG